MNDQPLIFWVDLETTGLNARLHEVLEVAAVITDATPALNIIPDSHFHAVRSMNKRTLANAKSRMNEYVTQMHTDTGLLVQIEAGEGMTLPTLDAALAEHIARFAEPGTMPVGGNSVRLDMNFIDQHLRATARMLDYHMRDVSSLAGFAHDAFGVPWFDKSAFGAKHSAQNDVMASIEEARYYMEWMAR